MAQVQTIGNETVPLMSESNGKSLTQTVLYPLRFEPIYQYRLWGGRRLADLLTAPLPTGPIGEAWILSDRRDHASQVSYCPMGLEGSAPHHAGLFNSHHRLATPVAPWERLKIGGGTPPILTRHGWLIIYHGVSEIMEPSNEAHPLCYWAGAMVLSKEHPQVIRYRSAEPVLTPSLSQERHGTVANVVFPTGIDRREDLGLPDRFDVYYGMADNRIGVARLDVPEFLPAEAVADPREQRCNEMQEITAQAVAGEK